MTTTFRTASRRRPLLAVHISGAALLFVAAGILASAAVEAGAGGPEVGPLAAAAAVVALVGAVLWRSTSIPARSTTLEAFTAVAVTWISVAVAGAVPFVFAGTFPRIDDALFESVSGFTGTGSTVLAPIETAPRGVLFWRSLTQWIGGMGMVVLAVAILPFLGVGGMELLRSEAPGPTADRLAPRVSGTAIRLWAIYGGFTLVSGAVFLVVGMSFYDAVVHAFTVVSTGGLAPHDASIGHFDSVAVETATIVLMLLGGTSFTLHWRFLTGERGAYWRSPLFRFYAGIFLVATTVLVAILVGQDDMAIGRAIRDASFNVATLLTSTGFGTADFVEWAPAAQIVLLALFLTGGMAGSTSGGLKLIRVRVLVEHAVREVSRIRRPRAILPIRLGSASVEETIVRGVIGYSLFFVAICAVGTLALALLGAGFLESAGAAVGSMSNMGPSLGDAGPAANFLYFTRPARAVIMLLMLAGRLEIYPVLFLAVAINRKRRDAVAAVDPRGRY